MWKCIAKNYKTKIQDGNREDRKKGERAKIQMKIQSFKFLIIFSLLVFCQTNQKKRRRKQRQNDSFSFSFSFLPVKFVVSFKCPEKTGMKILSQNERMKAKNLKLEQFSRSLCSLSSLILRNIFVFMHNFRFHSRIIRSTVAWTLVLLLYFVFKCDIEQNFSLKLFSFHFLSHMLSRSLSWSMRLQFGLFFALIRSVLSHSSARHCRRNKCGKFSFGQFNLLVYANA